MMVICGGSCGERAETSKCYEVLELCQAVFCFDILTAHRQNSKPTTDAGRRSMWGVCLHRGALPIYHVE